MEPAHIGLLVTGLIASVTGFWSFFKYFSVYITRQFDRFDKRQDKTDDLIRENFQILHTMQGSQTGFVTSDTCRLMSDKSMALVDTKIKEVKEDLETKIDAVESRLSFRIERLEDR
jgi:hypothetical protein